MDSSLCLERQRELHHNLMRFSPSGECFHAAADRLDTLLDSLTRAVKRCRKIWRRDRSDATPLVIENRRVPNLLDIDRRGPYAHGDESPPADGYGLIALDR